MSHVYINEQINDKKSFFVFKNKMKLDIFGIYLHVVLNRAYFAENNKFLCVTKKLLKAYWVHVLKFLCIDAYCFELLECIQIRTSHYTIVYWNRRSFSSSHTKRLGGSYASVISSP